MNILFTLWLPILLSSVIVFVISSLIHMVIRWHAGDYSQFANEDAIRDAIRAGNPKPGRYVIPFCREGKEMNSDAMRRKYTEGPIGHVTIGANGQPNLGKYLGQWFLWALVIAAVALSLAGHVYGLGADRAVAAARLAAAVTFIAHGFGTITESIWSMRPWSSSVKYLADAALYAAGTGLVVWWLWP